ncbi:MAG: hypothetical protein ACI837_000405 [Crocinitomicaceae bacterium]|jgi:hypothetical protein
MKTPRLLFSILTLISLVWLLILGYLEFSDELVSIDRGLSMVYAFILLISFLSIRISIIDAARMNIIVLLLGATLILLGTIQWTNPLLMTHLGSYSIIVSVLLLGTSINSQLVGSGKMTKVIRAFFLITLIFIAATALLSPNSALLFDIALVLLLLSTVGVLVSMFFQKRTN